jgi:hypothetical protein
VPRAAVPASLALASARTPDAAAEPATPADLVAELWRTMPPAMSPTPLGAPSGVAVAAALATALDRLAARAAALAERGGAGGEEARLLAETAGVMGAALRAWEADAPPAVAREPGAGGALASPLRLRLARMQRWLDARAAVDARAASAADLSLWTVEQLEGDGG